jgi:putative ABC transport system permease protein
MIKNYIKTALRNFWKHKLFTLINVVGLSIGISAALVIYLIVNFDFSFDKFHKDSDRIYRVVTNFTFNGNPVYNPGVCGPLPGAVKSQVTGVQTVGAFYRLFGTDVSIPKTGERPVKFKTQTGVVVIDTGYFNLIQYKWLVGSPQTALNGPYQVVLTSAQAKTYFPGLSFREMLGKTVVYDTIKTTVTGIVQSITENTGFTFHDFISYATGLANNDIKMQLRLHNWGGTSVKSQLFVKLYPNTSAASVEQQLNDLLHKNNPPQKNKTQAFVLQPLSDIHFSTKYSGIANFDDRADKTTLYSLLGIAAFLLLLGCINFINLTTAQATQRAKEIGIRKTMGSSRAQIIFQFLSETFVITLVAVLISIGLTPVILNLFADFIQPGITAAYLARPGVILFLTGLTMAVTLLAGFYPAILLSGYKPVLVLKNQAANNSSKTRSAYLRKSLTVAQFVIAQFFIMATAIVGKQIYFALHEDLGFKKDAIVMITAPYKNSNAAKNKLFLNRLRQIPQIEMVSLGNDAPSSENSSSTQGTYRDGKKEITMEIAEKMGDENYIKLYKIKLLAGRNLQPGDADKNVLINETYAHLIGLKNLRDAVGKQIVDFNGDMTLQIVGVVADFHQESIHAAIMPLAVMSTANNDYNDIFHIALKPQVATGDWQKAFAAMQAAWKPLYPDDDFQYQFVDESIAQLYQKEQRISTLLTWATGLSVLISCLGLLGLAIYTSNQRTKEIGIRKILGASLAQLITLLSTEMMLLILLAFVIVTPIAWYAMNKWMQSFADRTPISWWIFVLSGGGMLMVALFTSGFQTVKAAVANPVKSLRSE